MFLCSSLLFSCLILSSRNHQRGHHMERFVILPFSIGSCASQSSVEVIENPAKKTKSDPNPSSTRGQGGEDASLSSTKVKNPNGLLAIPKLNISFGIQKLIKSIKTFSQFFVYKEEDDDEEREMEIGLPTDVKHVAHIGWDGSTTTTTSTSTKNTTNNSNSLKDCFLWDNIKAHHADKDEDQLLSSSLPTSTISLRQFELAMAAQAHTPPPPSLVFGSSFKKPTTTSC